MAIQPGGQGRRRLLLVVVGCTAALALLAATRPAGAPAELQQRGRRGRGGAFTLAAQKIARAAAILRCVRTQGLSGGCPMAKVQGGAASGFEVPEYTEGGQQWNENSAGWTAAGVLDNAPGGYATVDPWHEHSKAGGVKETYGEPVPAGSVANRGGVGTSCGCAVCPCRGDDDLDIVGNGDWAWPTAKHSNAYVRGLKYSPKRAAAAAKCPDCLYTATVKPLSEHFLATVSDSPASSSSSDASSSDKRSQPRSEKVITKYIKVPMPVYKTRTVYKENTVYVPVYDDPFWNPEADGRLAGEGVGMPHASPMGAQKYDKGAWYEWGKKRHNMLDALGGTLDSDTDVDHPADLGVWWSDSLPSGKFASSLSDSDSF